MEEFNFSSLAPRRGTRPLLSDSAIGLSSMNGGAINWGSIWSGLKSFGTAVKNYGAKAWHSSTGQALRQKLKDTNVQEKLVDTISSGIHGALDIGRQELDKALSKRLEQQPHIVTESAIDKLADSITENFNNQQHPPPQVKKKRSRSIESEDIILPIKLPEYESDPSNIPKPLKVIEPPIEVLKKPVSKQTAFSSLPVLPTRNRTKWQNTLSNIVGLGVHTMKKRRCF